MIFQLGYNHPLLISCPFFKSNESARGWDLEAWKVLLDRWFKTSLATGANQYTKRHYRFFTDVREHEEIVDWYARLWFLFIMAMGLATVLITEK